MALDESISNYSVNRVTSTEKENLEHLVCEVSQLKIKSKATQMENGKEQDLLYPKNSLFTAFQTIVSLMPALYVTDLISVLGECFT